MTTRIGLISDVHSSPLPLQQALQIFEREAVDEIICAGDIAGYYDTLAPTVQLLQQSGCYAVLGNHDLEYLAQSPGDCEPAVTDYLQQLPQSLALEIEGKRLLVVHANPPAEQTGGIRLLDETGDVRPERRQEWIEKLAGIEHDVLIVGHTHQVYALQLGDVFVVNPGSSVFNHCCMILSLPDLGVREFALGSEEIVKCWNFGMLYS